MPNGIHNTQLQRGIYDTQLQKSSNETTLGQHPDDWQQSHKQ